MFSMRTYKRTKTLERYYTTIDFAVYSSIEATALLCVVASAFTLGMTSVRGKGVMRLLTFAFQPLCVRRGAGSRRGSCMVPSQLHPFVRAADKSGASDAAASKPAAAALATISAYCAG